MAELFNSNKSTKGTGYFPHWLDSSDQLLVTEGSTWVSLKYLVGICYLANTTTCINSSIKCHLWQFQIILLTKVSYTACTTNTMYILFNVTGQVKVYDMLYIWDIQSSCCYLVFKGLNQVLVKFHRPNRLTGSSFIDFTYCCGNKNWALARTELVQCFLSVSLRAISMYTCTGISFMVQEVLKSICTLFSFHEHQSQGILA